MISLDGSVIPAIIIFLGLVVSLNYLLFQPLIRIQSQREKLTTGSMAESRMKLQQYVSQLDSYQAAIRNGRMETYRQQELIRSDAMKKRVDVLGRARTAAEGLVQESQEQLNAQVQAAKLELTTEARDLAIGIASAVLRRPA
jgi:F-type H+-transporting ATPase subunit b